MKLVNLFSRKKVENKESDMKYANNDLTKFINYTKLFYFKFFYFNIILLLIDYFILFLKI